MPGLNKSLEQSHLENSKYKLQIKSLQAQLSSQQSSLASQDWTKRVLSLKTDLLQSKAELSLKEDQISLLKKRISLLSSQPSSTVVSLPPAKPESLKTAATAVWGSALSCRSSRSGEEERSLKEEGGPKTNFFKGLAREREEQIERLEQRVRVLEEEGRTERKMREQAELELKRLKQNREHMVRAILELHENRIMTEEDDDILD